MYRYKIIVIAMFLCILPLMQTQAQSEDDVAVNNKVNTPRITVINLDINDKTLKMVYEIRNDSEQDIWICEDLNWNLAHRFEVYLDEDAQTLMIRRRYNVPLIPYTNPPIGRYVRLPTNESRTESVLIPLPVHRKGLFSGSGLIRDTVYAVSLLLEIGYYTGDLPGMIRGVLEKVERNTAQNKDKFTLGIRSMGGPLHFNCKNESLSQRDEQVIVAYTWQELKGELVLSARIDGQRIPYTGKNRYPGFTPPDLIHCTRVEIRYQPSMLEYFFPYDGQQSLLSLEEKKYLQSEKLIVVDDPEDLKAFASEVSNQVNYIGGMVCERSNAKVVCYRDAEMLTSFTVYDDKTIETEQEQRIKYRRVLQSLRKLTPHIQPLELRMQCAANLKNLWYRYSLYQYTTKSIRVGLFRRRMSPYPAPNKWCNDILQAYWRKSDEYTLQPLKCPSSGQGKCHYAMNRNCKLDSPPDMVLLFETKAGWNQNGGPELFTFDNHDPKGGCVLLNDGTVKFIRTKEELQQLRWK